MSLTQSEALAAVASGETLIGTGRSPYPGKAVEYKPRKDVVGGKPTSHPDVYPWHVVGQPDHDRMRNVDLEIR